MSNLDPVVNEQGTVVQPTYILPEKPRPTKELERDADQAVAYLERLASSSRLDPELRLAMNDIKNTIKTLKGVVVRMSEEAQANHDKMVELVRSQRLM